MSYKHINIKITNRCLQTENFKSQPIFVLEQASICKGLTIF